MEEVQREERLCFYITVRSSGVCQYRYKMTSLTSLYASSALKVKCLFFSKLSLFLWVMQKPNRLKLLDVLCPRGGLHLIQALERGLSEHNLQIKNTSVSFRALSQPLYTIQ